MENMNTIRTILVDDEALARRALKRCLAAYPQIVVIAECETGTDAVTQIRSLSPDLVFLDIEMPGIDGLQVAERLRPGSLPIIVFVTAHDRYALDAFRVQAMDFVLKPLNDCRIAEVMDRVIDQIRHRRLDVVGTRLETVLKKMEHARTPDREAAHGSASSSGTFIKQYAIKERGRIKVIEIPSIDWIEACGNYVTLHVAGAKHLVRETMNTMESRLDPSTFLRIHRSIIVNTRSVSELRPFFNGSYLVMLKDQTRLFSSRGYHPKVEQYIQALQ